MTNKEMQDLCRNTIEYLKSVIAANMTLIELKELCEKYMLDKGADSFWYWDVGVFIFSGDETAVSVSGREYTVSERKIKENDIITVDLSPQNNCVWGDHARTIIFQKGKIVDNIGEIENEEWKKGLQTELMLHKKIKEIASPKMTFEELYYYFNDMIASSGFVNLDFMGNLGHSVVNDKNDRIYIEKGNKRRLSEVEMFTFEPHISLPNSKFGFKREDIYFFEENILIKL